MAPEERDDVAPTELDDGHGAPAPPSPPSRIGPYRIVEEIGRGGMGTVYLAERADGQFEQRVAVKLMRAGLDSTAAQRRFAAERRILARLQHPNIARLLDGGVASDGRPFLVVELVPGQAITRYCDERRLAVDTRLELFKKMGAAVEYAHRNLVVHRDLKPSNILVTDDGTVKLLDFGIAKLLGQQDDTESPETEAGLRPLTPEYSAPEQAAGEPITTATDTHGLGLVLYELLTGRRAYRIEGRTPAELDRVTRKLDPPPRPSVAVREPGDLTPEEIAAARATTPTRLARRLAGDLDTICLMAVRHEPERRYRSAASLLDDVERHRTQRPVVARGDSFGYRAGKALRRHRLGLSVAGAFLALLVGSAAVTAVQGARIARERDKAERVSELLVELFEIADPGRARGESITAREILDAGVGRIGDGLSTQPEVQAALLDVMGQVYRNLGLYDRAAPLLERALATREQLDPDGAAVAESLTHLGLLRADQGEFDEAEEILRRALEIHRRTAGPEDVHVARGMNHLGTALFRRGDYDAAEPLLRAALELSRHQEDAGSDVAAGLNDLGMLLYGRGDYTAAEPLLAEAAAMRRELLGEDHPAVADTLSNLASALSRQGRYEDAERHQRESLDIRQSILGPEHPRVAVSLNNLGLILYSRGEHESSEPYLRESLEIRRQGLGDSHPDTAQSLSNLGLLLQATGRIDEAETLYREALDTRRRAYGESHIRVAQSLNNLALLLQAKSELVAAERLLREGREMLRETVGEQHPFYATDLNNLAAVLDQAGVDGEAEALYREALEIRRGVLPARHPHIAYALVGLGRLLTRSGRTDEAVPLLEEAVAIRREVFGDDAAATREALDALGRAR